MAVSGQGSQSKTLNGIVGLKMPIGSVSHIPDCPSGPAGGVAEQSCALTKYDTACHEMLLGKIFYILPSNSLDLLLIKK